jgi:hypothetical protein
MGVRSSDEKEKRICVTQSAKSHSDAGLLPIFPADAAHITILVPKVVQIAYADEK